MSPKSNVARRAKRASAGPKVSALCFPYVDRTGAAQRKGVHRTTVSEAIARAELDLVQVEGIRVPLLATSQVDAWTPRKRGRPVKSRKLGTV